MPIQREKSQSISVLEYDLKPFIAVTYKYPFPYGAAAIPGKELRQILQMLQRLSVLHPEQFCHGLRQIFQWTTMCLSTLPACSRLNDSAGF